MECRGYIFFYYQGDAKDKALAKPTLQDLIAILGYKGSEILEATVRSSVRNDFWDSITRWCLGGNGGMDYTDYYLGYIGTTIGIHSPFPPKYQGDYGHREDSYSNEESICSVGRTSRHTCRLWGRGCESNQATAINQS